MRIWRRGRTRRKFKLTRSGRAFVLITIGVGIAAVNTANNLLYLVLGFLLSLLLVSGVLSDLALWRLRIERNVAQRVFAGTTALVELAVTNSKLRLASLAIEVAEVLDEPPAPARFVRIPPDSTETTSYRLTALKRGRLQLTRLRVTTRYPFGLIEKGYAMFSPEEVMVYPKLLERAQCPPLDAIPGEIAPQSRPGDGVEPAASIRDYRAGDAARDIHWRRTASRGELLVREREQQARAQVTLYVDNRFPAGGGDAGWRQEFERKISEAATLASIYLGRGVAVELRTPDAGSATVEAGGAPDPIWRLLALLQPVAASATRRAA